MIPGMSRVLWDDIRLPLLLLMLLVQGFLLLRLGWLTSPNRTELGHIAASLRVWETGTFDLFHVNPPFLRILVGGAVVHVVDPQTNWSDYSVDPTKRSEWGTGAAFVRANDWETVRSCFFVGRAVCIPLILLGGYFGYRFAREMFGEPSGFVFLILWTFSPWILGWGATICPDVVAASLGIVAFYVFWYWFKIPTWKFTAVAGLMLGLLPLTKLTWIVALGLVPILWLFISHKTRKSFRQLIVLLMTALFVLNLGYCFDGSFKRLGDYTFHSASLTNSEGTNKFTDSWIGRIPVPFPEQFVLGFDTQQCDFENGFPSYLFGHYSEHGWWYYYFAALCTKETLGTLGLTIIAIVLFWFAPFRTVWQTEVIILVPFLLLFGIVSSQTGFSLHSRYLIPALPFLYLWISRTGRLCLARFVPVRMIVPVLLLCGAGSSFAEFPHSLSYLNEVVRYRTPPPLLGSNIDWGQDLYELKDWLDRHPEARPLHAVISTIFPIETLDIRDAGQSPAWRPDQKPTGTWEQQLSMGPQPGWYLLGTNDLYDAEYRNAWFQALVPAKRIGRSLCLFHVTFEDANHLREKDGLPKLYYEDFSR
jgi:hypothetical protein